MDERGRRVNGRKGGERIKAVRVRQNSYPVRTRNFTSVPVPVPGPRQVRVRVQSLYPYPYPYRSMG